MGKSEGEEVGRHDGNKEGSLVGDTEGTNDGGWMEGVIVGITE